MGYGARITRPPKGSGMNNINDTNITNKIYHVTHVRNSDSIMRVGIDPKLSTGARDITWWSAYHALPSAISHVASRHGWLMDELIIFEVCTREYAYTRTRWSGIYTIAVPVRAVPFSTVKTYLMQYDDPEFD